MTCGLCFFRRIHQAEIDNADAQFFKLLGYLLNVPRQTFLESFELRPIRIESDAEEPHGELVTRTLVAHIYFHSADPGTVAKPEEPEWDSIVKVFILLKKLFSSRIFRPREHIAPCSVRACVLAQRIP